MRNLGDHAWLNDWIGAPYLHGGRGPAYDCYGLVVAIYRDEFDIDLPDWLDLSTMDLKGNADRIESVLCSGDWTEVDAPQDGDFVVCYRAKLAHHIGLYFGGGVIHCTTGLGVMYEPLSRFAKNYKRLVFGEWRP